VIHDRGEPADDRAVNNELTARLRRAVMLLPDELRFAVSAHYWGDAPVREIARIEGVSEVAIRKRLKRAFAVLRRGVEEVIV
jgi:RNA polymerase sigma factor (sigma-70 family)